MHALSAEERDRLIDTVSSDPDNIARCLPWLPEETASQAAVNEISLHSALAAFAEASPTARARHAALVQRLVAQATSRHLGALTRLACAVKEEDVWRRVQTLIRRSPGNAQIADIAAQWDDLDETVHDVIFTCAKRSDICAAIAAAQGQRDVMAMHISETTAAAFVAALKPDVWDALHTSVQRQWRWKLVFNQHFAIRSLGPRPEFLARVQIDNDLVRAVQRHTCDDATLHRTLLPVALRHLPPDEAHALITALPTPPPDPGAFFCVAGGWRGEPNVIPSIRDDMRRPARRAQVIAIQRTADCCTSFRAGYEALRHALRGWTWDDLKTIAPILDDDARTAITPDRDALIQRLAHPDRKEAMRQALDRLTSLPPDIAVPSQSALHRLGTGIVNGQEAQKAADAIADALRDHGDVFLAIVDALEPTRRSVTLPLPWDKAVANALRALARDDPPSAQRMACTLRSMDRRAATDIALSLPAHHRDALTPAADTLVQCLAPPDQRDALRQALDRLADLPLEETMLTRFALDHLARYSRNERDARMAAEDVARALRAHGDVFLTIVDTVANAVLRNILLPLPKNAAQADALRALARDDPLSAHRLAHALGDQKWINALHALLTAPPYHTDAVWQTFAEAERHAMTSEFPTVTPTIVALAERVPIVSLALGAVQADDADMREAAIAALAARSDALRAIWLMLPQEMHQFLRSLPALSDVTGTLDPPSVRRFRRR